ncbi:MAG: zinc ribbon domain-containing protein [Treponema sp.]|jgi:putative FmdB family regulatory protein|nr:zinc ribbon domain-containing protein [Treponema sp.]
MPTYEYECKSCGHTFEAFQRMSDEPLRDCPQCGREVRRLINGGTGVIFKGSGFYVTDKNKGAAAKAGAKTPAGGPEKNTAVEKPDAPGGKTPAPEKAASAAGDKSAPAGGSAPAVSAEKKASGQ